MYFSNFPKIVYDFDLTSGVDYKVVTDITRNVRLRKQILENISLYDYYDIAEGETPEIISEKIYGTPYYHWVIMLVNQRYDYITDFPLEYPALIANTAEKYNPILYSLAGDWRFADGKIYVKLQNLDDSAELEYLTTAVPFTLKGATTEHGNFTITDIFGAPGTGLDEITQEFYATTATTGTPTGDLTVTTTLREYEPLYYVNADGYQVSADQPGVTGVTGLEYEEIQNEAKRRIKIISPDVITQILKQYKELM